MYLILASLLFVAVQGETILLQAPVHTVSSASAAAVSGETHLPIGVPVELQSTQYASQDLLGQYSYGYSIGDEVVKKEMRNANGDVSGGYTYTSPEGQKVSITYTAGTDGFRASGDAIPKPVEPTQDVSEATKTHLTAITQAEAKALAEEEKPKLIPVVSPLSYSPLPYVYAYSYPGHHVTYSSSAPQVKYLHLQPLQPQQNPQLIPNFVYTYNFAA